MEACALCEKEEVFQESHFIPKFIFDWIKKTSPTPYLRDVISPDLRRQDGIKQKFLCRLCEQKFSKFENYFAEVFFYPFMHKKQASFEYNKNLKNFIISVSWRILKRELYSFKQQYPKLGTFAEQAEVYWRKVLLQNLNDDIYEHHLLLLDYILEAPKDLPDNFQVYIMRGVDGTIAFSDDEIFLYFKIPGMIFVSSIQPKNLSGWKNTIINSKGIMDDSSAICEHPGFTDFLFNRVNMINENKVSDKQREKIKRDVLKDIDRLKKSKLFEAWVEELKRKQNS